MTTTKPKPNTERRTRAVEILESRALEDGTHEITIAASNVARDNFDLDLASMRLENYLRNPVVLWAHDRRMPPIGRTRGIERVDGGKLRARFEFADDPFAQRISHLWDQEIIRAASISWGGGDLTFLDGGMIRETNAELYEWSLVPVPADPDALRMDDELTVMRASITALTERLARLESGGTTVPIEPRDVHVVTYDLDSLAREFAGFKAYLEGRESA